jgi:DNA-binding NarL/FixJ family response regulator
MKGSRENMSAGSLSVIIIDDSPAIRRRLVEMIAEQVGVQVVAEAGDTLEGLELTERLGPDVVIVDIRMPGRSGTGMLEDLKALERKPTVIVLTNYPYIAYRRRCISLGADHFFDKSTQFDRVLQVLREMCPRVNRTA